MKIKESKLVRNFKRNRKLVDFKQIPDVIRENILNYYAMYWFKDGAGKGTIMKTKMWLLKKGYTNLCNDYLSHFEMKKVKRKRML